jgi:D-psicose/D-tagatose/L-ribulose 3-epimerase
VAIPYRFAVCNELFEKVSFEEACKQVRGLGYEGLEIAPYTLGEDPSALSSGDRAQVRNVIEAEGLSFAGLHWLLVGPAGLHATTRDEAVRRRTWNYVRDMVDLCADFAGAQARDRGVLVFGSPKQRSTRDGMTPREATDVFTQELAEVAPHAESRGVTILVEALPANQSDVINRLADAVSIVRQIDSPAVQTMFDTHNAVDETEPHADVVRKYFSYIRHVHVNEIDGREPGMGDYDFAPLLAALAELKYSGWVSLEAFDFSRDPGSIASGSLRHLKAAMPQAGVSQLV